MEKLNLKTGQYFYFKNIDEITNSTIILKLLFKPLLMFTSWPLSRYSVVIGKFMKKQSRQIIIAFLISSSCLKGQVILTGNLGNVYSDNNGYIYWTGTIAFSAINLTTTYFNIKKLHKHDKYRSNAIFGAISGAAQTALGFANVNEKYRNAYIPTSINIGTGLTTLVTSVVRLATKNPPKENNVSLNFIYLPDYQENSSIVGLTFKKQF